MTTTADTTYQLIETGRLFASPNQPRKHIDAKKLDELMASIEKSGIRTPLIVRPAAGGRFEIGAGERRWRAATKLKLPVVPALVQALDDAEFLELLNFENLNREDLHEMEEAEGFQRLLELPNGRWDVAAIAQKIGKSASHVYERLHLLKLVKPVREAFFAGGILGGHATDIARLAPDDQLQALKAATGKLNTFQREPMTVRELRGWIQRDIIRELSKAPFDTKDAQLLPVAGACGPCPKRAANNPELFGDLAKGDRCMDGSCFTEKTERWLDGIRAKAKGEGFKVVDLKSGYGAGSGKGLNPDKWQRAGEKVCDDLAVGIFLEPGYAAGQHQNMGATLKVCLKPHHCKVHNPKTAAARASSRSSSSSSPRLSASNPVLDLRERCDRKVFDLVRHKLKVPLAKADLIVILNEELPYCDGEELLVEAYGWKSGDLRNEKTRAKILDDLSANDLMRLLVEVFMARDVGQGGMAPVLHGLADRYGVDPKKVEAEVKAEDAAKAKAAKDEKAKKATPAKKAAGKKKGGKK